MTTEDQTSSAGPEQPAQGQGRASREPGASSIEELFEELGRLGHKFVELLETAWNSEQRRQIEQDLRTGLNDVADSLGEGLKDISEKEKTKEFIGKAESVADDVAVKVRSSEVANELARGLASGLHSLTEQLDKMAREMRSARPASEQQPSGPKDAAQSQDIPVSREEPKPPTDT